MATYVPPKRATAFICYIHLQSATTPNDFQANPTLAAGDVKVSKDGGAFANLTTLPAVTPAGGRAVKVDLSATEMTADNIVVEFVDQTSPKEWADLAICLQTAARQVDDLAYPNTSGRGMDVDASGGVEVGSFQTGALTAAAFAAGAVDAAALAADAGTEIGTAVWATTTRQLTALDEDVTTLDLDATIRAAVGLASANLDTQISGVQSDTNDIQTRLPAALVGGKMDSIPELETGTAQAGAAGSITLRAGASAVNNFYIDQTVAILSGTGAGQSRIIASYLGATKVASIVLAWATNPDNTSVYAIIPTGVASTRMIGGITQSAVDIAARIGAPAGASISADIAAIEAALPSDPADASDIAASFSTVNSTLATISGYIDTEVAAILAAVDTEVAAIKAKTDSLTFTVAGMVDANVIDWKSATAPAMTGDAYARLGAPVGASISADIAGVQADTDNIQTRIPAALVGGRMDSVMEVETGTAQAGAAGSITLRAGASAVDNLHLGETIAILSGTGAGQTRIITSYTGSTKVATVLVAWATNPDNTSVYAVLPIGPVDAKMVAGAAQTAGNIVTLLGTLSTDISTLAGYVDTEVAAIKAKTDNLPSDPADASVISARFDAVDAALGGVSTTTDVSGIAAAVRQLGRPEIETVRKDGVTVKRVKPRT